MDRATPGSNRPDSPAHGHCRHLPVHREHAFERGFKRRSWPVGRGAAAWRWSTSGGRRRIAGREAHVRPAATAGPGRRDVRARRHVDVQGRDCRRGRDRAGPDFYKPAHAIDLRVIVGPLFPRRAGRPDHRLRRVGPGGQPVTGPAAGPTSTRLISTVPTAANAGYYAQIVAEKAILRRLVDAGTRITRLGYGGGEGQPGSGEVDEIVDRAERGDLRGHRAPDQRGLRHPGGAPPADHGRDRRDRQSRGGQSAGVPTGFIDLDKLTNGLHPGQMVIIAARPGVGKSTLALDMGAHAAVKPPHAVGDLLVGDEPQRDHHAAAVGGGRASSSRQCGTAGWASRVAEDRQADERDLRRAAVHRRQSEHDDDGDQGQGPPAQAAATDLRLASSTTCSS